MASVTVIINTYQKAMDVIVISEQEANLIIATHMWLITVWIYSLGGSQGQLTASIIDWAKVAKCSIKLVKCTSITIITIH